MKTFPTLWKQSASTFSKDTEKLFQKFNSVWLDAERAFEAFDRTFPVGLRDVNFPPCDIVKTETGYAVALAVAGFTKDELSAEVDTDNVITVSGKKETKNDSSYIVKGIATRQFVRKWQLAEQDEVQDVKLVDGLLTIAIKRNEDTVSVKRLTITTE